MKPEKSGREGRNSLEPRYTQSEQIEDNTLLSKALGLAAHILVNCPSRRAREDREETQRSRDSPS